MKRYFLPGIIITGTAAIFGIAAYQTSLPHVDGNLDKGPSAAATSTRRVVISNNVWLQDTDHDTLKDWEESLWGTDPKVADTDGDGVGDGEEVRARIAVGDAPTRSDNEEYAPTPFITNPGKNNSNSTTSPDTSDTNSSTATKKETQEQRALREFGNLLSFRITDIQLTHIQKQIPLFKKLATSTPEALGALSVAADDYRFLEKTVRAIAHPRSADATVAALAGSYRDITSAIDAIVAFKAQGKPSPTSITNYNNALVANAQAIYATGDFFSAQGVEFSPDEPGYIFTFLSGIIKK